MSRDVGAIAVEARAWLMDRMEEAVSRHAGDGPGRVALRSELQSAILTAFSVVFCGNTNPLHGIEEDEADGPVVF